MIQEQEQLDFETAMARLEQVLRQLDNGEIPLAEAIDLYKNGLSMVQICSGHLDKAQGELKILMNQQFVDMEQ